jgi:hypothetical protein
MQKSALLAAIQQPDGLSLLVKWRVRPIELFSLLSCASVHLPEQWFSPDPITIESF